MEGGRKMAALSQPSMQAHKGGVGAGVAVDGGGEEGLEVAGPRGVQQQRLECTQRMGGMPAAARMGAMTLARVAAGTQLVLGAVHRMQTKICGVERAVAAATRQHLPGRLPQRMHQPSWARGAGMRMGVQVQHVPP